MVNLRQWVQWAKRVQCEMDFDRARAFHQARMLAEHSPADVYEVEPFVHYFEKGDRQRGLTPWKEIGAVIHRNDGVTTLMWMRSRLAYGPYPMGVGKWGGSEDLKRQDRAEAKAYSGIFAEYLRTHARKGYLVGADVIVRDEVAESSRLDGSPSNQ